MDDSVLETAARRYEQVAAELTAAAAHLRTCAGHFRDGEVPRGCAHAFAAHGHMRAADAALTELAIEHAGKSRPGPPNTRGDGD